MVVEPIGPGTAGGEYGRGDGRFGARDARPMMDRPMGVQLSDDYPCAPVRPLGSFIAVRRMTVLEGF